MTTFLVLATSADETNTLTSLTSLTSSSFRVKTTLTVSYDGSEKASDIERSFSVVSEIVFYDRDQWRFRKQLPVYSVYEEVLRKGQHYSVMKPSGEPIYKVEPVNDSHWLEILASPLRLAASWSLTDSKSNLDDFLSQLRNAPNFTLQNADGDKVVGHFNADKSVKIESSGKILQDSKTEVSVSETWELSEVNRISEKDLLKSLTRSP